MFKQVQKVECRVTLTEAALTSHVTHGSAPAATATAAAQPTGAERLPPRAQPHADPAETPCTDHGVQAHP